MVRSNPYCESIFCTLQKMELRNMISCYYEKSLDFTYKNRVQVLDINKNKFKLHQDHMNNDEVTHLKHDSYLEASFTFRMQTQSQKETSFSFHIRPSFSLPKQGRHLKEGDAHVIGDPPGATVEEKNIASSPVIKTKTSEMMSQGSGGYLISSRELGILFEGFLEGMFYQHRKLIISVELLFIDVFLAYEQHRSSIKVVSLPCIVKLWML